MAYPHGDDDAFDPKLVAAAEARERQERHDRGVREEQARRNADPRPPKPVPKPSVDRARYAAKILSVLAFYEEPRTRLEIAKDIWPFAGDDDALLNLVPTGAVTELVVWGWVVTAGDDRLAITQQGRVMVALAERR
jgi:hypothetical protein